MNYKIFPPEEMLMARVQLPVSKSYLARKMVIDAIAGAPANAACSDDPCEDITAMSRALDVYAAPSPGAEIDLGGSGTALRLLTALFAATDGCEVVLTGNDSLRRRPMTILVEALRQLGAEIEYLDGEGYAPLRIRGRRLAGGSLPIDPTVSSQYITALMLIAPMLESELRLRLEGEAVSTPYIKMTAEMMRRRGAVADIERYDINLAPGKYDAADKYPVERDWSAASYWYEIAAITAGWITLPGLHADDLQGDRALVDIMPRLGVLSDFEPEDDEDDEDGLSAPDADGNLPLQLSATPDLWGRLELDLSQNPDLTPALAVTSAALSIPFHLTGLENLRVKECDRLEALRKELLKIGVVAEIEGPGTLSWEGRRVPVVELPVIETYGDHRMAMAFAPLAAFAPGMVVKDVEVVAKSYPAYWTDLQAAGFTLEAPEEA